MLCNNKYRDYFRLEERDKEEDGEIFNERLNLVHEEIKKRVEAHERKEKPEEKKEKE